MLEGDIGGGLILQRKLTIPKDNPKIFKIDSKILARRVGAGSGGFSRSVSFCVIFCLFLTQPLLTALILYHLGLSVVYHLRSTNFVSLR